MAFNTSSKRLKLSTFKLNALLSMAQAISSEMKIEDLIDRFRTILNDDLEIDRVLFFKREKEWELLLKTNCSDRIIENIDVERDLIQYSDITFVSTSDNSVLQEFDIIIPVIQNNLQLAYILIADTKEFAKGVSATIKHLNFVQTLSIIIFVAIENLRLFLKTIEQEAMRKELELASKMQNLLIPSPNSLPQSSKLSIHSYYRPHFEVGGDFYDVIQLNSSEVGFCIADVSGKGISAALLMSNFQANLRALFNSEISLRGLIDKLNERVMGTAKGERFITIFIGRFNTSNGLLEYVNAGHNPPLLYNTKIRENLMLKDGCVGLGMLDDIPHINVGSLYVSQHSKLLCYTDGLVEYTKDDKVEFDTKSIERAISNDLSLEENIESLIEDRFGKDGNKDSGIFDDISILGFEFKP